MRGPDDGDDRDFPPYGLRIWPEEQAHRRQLGVNETVVSMTQPR
jgi:hypothetical protein